MNFKCYRLTFPIIAVMIVIAMLFVVLPVDSSDGAPEDPITRSGYFDPNGGTAQYREGEEYLEGNYEFTDKSSVYIPGYMFTADGVDYVYSKVGYAFLGWAETADATEATWTEGDVREFDEGDSASVRFYAVWTAVNYNVIFNLNQTSTSPGTANLFKLLYGETLETIHMMDSASSELSAYTIVGWTNYNMLLDPDNASRLSSNQALLLKTGAIPNACLIRDNENNVIGPTTVKLYPMKISLDAENPQDLSLYPIYALTKNMSNTNGVTISDNGCYYITGTRSGSGSNSITVSGGSPRIYASDLNLDYTNAGKSPFVISGTAKVLFITLGDCSFTGGSAKDGNYILGYAGINVQRTATFTMDSFCVGSVTVLGGTARGTHSGGYYGTNVVPRSGFGIGANGVKNSPYYDYCGIININGGKLIATGGEALFPQNYYSSAYCGGGIGGRNGETNIAAGVFVTATSGIMTAYDSDGYYFTASGTVFDPVVGDLNADGAYLSQFGRTSSEVYGDSAAKLIFTFTGDKQISNGKNLTIVHNGTTYVISLGGAEVKTNSSIYVDSSWVAVGDPVTISSEGTYTGYGEGSITSSSTISEGGRTITQYRVTLSSGNQVDSYHADVSILIGGSSLHGNSSLIDNYGSLNPSDDFSLQKNNSGALSFTFTLNLFSNYKLTEAKYKYNTGSWNNATIVPDNNVEGKYLVTVSITFGDSYQNAVNTVDFIIEKKTVVVSFTNNYSDAGTTFSQTVITPDVSNPEGIVWDNAKRSQGHQTVYYDDSRTYTVYLANSPNPFHLASVTVDNQNVIVTKIDVATSPYIAYTFTIYNITKNLNVVLHFEKTIKVKLYDFRAGGNVICDALLVDENGEELEHLQSGNDGAGYYCYTWVRVGASVYFTVAIKETYKETYGLSSISISSGGATYPVGAHHGNFYVLAETSNGDTTITPNITDLYYWITMRSNIGTDEDPVEAEPYTFKVPKDSLYVMPSLEELIRGNQVGIREGYRLLHWTDVSGDIDHEVPSGNVIYAGTEVTISWDRIFRAVWANTPEQYNITWNLQSGSSPSEYTYPATYYVTERLAIPDPVKPGYIFRGWTGTDLDTPTFSLVIPKGSTGDRSYTATWSDPLSYRVTFINPQDTIHIDISPEYKEVVFGDLYYSLPIYSNATDDLGNVYTFRGWALPSGDRVEADTRVTIAENHNLTIIWFFTGYTIQVTSTSGGTASTGTPVVVAGLPVKINFTPADGFEFTSISINGTPVVNPTIVDEGSGNYSFTFTPTSNSRVHVVFTHITYTIIIHQGEDQSTEWSTTYHVDDSSPFYISKSSVPDQPGITFYGWVTDPQSTTYLSEISVPIGSTGDREYWEVWKGALYIIEYHLVHAEAVNPPQNPTTYHYHDTFTFQPAQLVGYKFLGWYDGDTLVPGVTYNTWGNLELTAHWVPVDTLPAVTSFVYDSTEKHVLDPANYYNVSGTYFATHSDDYTVTLTLTPGHIWSDDTYDSTKVLNWSITPRPIYVISQSEFRSFDGTPLTASGYVTFGILSNEKTHFTITVSGSQTDVGIGANTVTCVPDGTLTATDYSIVCMTGTLIVTEPGTATVTAGIPLPTSGPATMAMISPGRRLLP